MSPQRRWLRGLRRVTLVLALAGIGYLGYRFDVVPMPSTRCSPVARFEAGDRLVVDLRPAAIQPGDAVLIRDAEGGLHLVVVSATRDDGARLWCSSDCPDCEGFDSAAVGWVDRRAVTGRVLLAWVY